MPAPADLDRAFGRMRREGLSHSRMNNARVAITASSLVGKGSTSPFFLLSYLVLRRRGARDWWFGSPVALSHDGTYKIEYHHIHPRARLRERYSKAEINDLANLAFISDKANRKISARPPATYFAELETLDQSFLTGHMVPTDQRLRSLDAYPELIAERRAMLAAAMNDLLESFRPAFLDAMPSGSLGETSASLVIEAFGTSLEADDVLLVFHACLADHEAGDGPKSLRCCVTSPMGGEERSRLAPSCSRSTPIRSSSRSRLGRCSWGARLANGGRSSIGSLAISTRLISSRRRGPLSGAARCTNSLFWIASDLVVG